MTAQKHARHIAITESVSSTMMALFHRGVADYAAQHGGWVIVTGSPNPTGVEDYALTVHALRGWHGDGAITTIRSQAEARAARQLCIPAVNHSGVLRGSYLPRVMMDFYGVGRLAADHLFQQGFRRLAYCGAKGLWHSHQRAQGFAQRAQEAGAKCDIFETTPSLSSRTPWRKRIAPLLDWLRSLEFPAGVLTFHDFRARMLIDACHQLGLNVPHDVAVIGADNDITVCESCEPTISSVSRDGWREGYEAAAMLDLLMNGKTPPRHDIAIPPDGIVERQSTDTVAIEDRHVAAAVHFMRDHVDENFGIERVMQQVSISRRQLEQRFRRILGCAPHEHLSRVRIERAKKMLASPNQVKLSQVARACGVSSEEQLRVMFHRLVGCAPQTYRRDQLSRKKYSASLQNRGSDSSPQSS